MYISCPECGGASFFWTVPHHMRYGDVCPRCKNTGSILEKDATPDEIEKERRFWEENDRWRNKTSP